MKKLLETLTEAVGPSGYEDEVRAIVRSEIKSLAGEPRVDALGNLSVHRRPGRSDKNSTKIMVTAHMDEIGMMVRHVDEDGFVRFSATGSISAAYLLGARVRFADGTRGVVGSGGWDHPNQLPALENLHIDVGATARSDCPVKIGDVATFEGAYQEVGGRLVAKAMDNRVGVLVALEALRSLKSTPYEVIFVFSTQQQVGTRGAPASAWAIAPDIALAVDVTPAGAARWIGGPDISLGKGPCIKIQDASLIADPRVVHWIRRAAEKNKIPYQSEVASLESSEAAAIQRTGIGVPCGGISIPVRYIHSPSEMVDSADVQNAVRLLLAVLHTPIEL